MESISGTCSPRVLYNLMVVVVQIMVVQYGHSDHVCPDVPN